MNKARNSPASITSFQLYGIPRSIVLHTLTSYPTISKADEAEWLKEYYLLYCSREHFVSNHHAGCYYRSDREYVIVYSGCTRWEAVNHPYQLSLSFREAQKEYNLPAYVLVSLNFPFKRKENSRSSINPKLSLYLENTGECND